MCARTRRVLSSPRMDRCADSPSMNQALRRSTPVTSRTTRNRREERVMRREGSPFQGLGAVAVKELSDNLSSARMFVLEWLIVLTALAALYGAIDSLRQNTAEDPFLLLRLFTVDRAPLPSFVAILGFLIPLMAIGLGFDAVNSEHN